MSAKGGIQSLYCAEGKQIQLCGRRTASNSLRAISDGVARRRISSCGVSDDAISRTAINTYVRTTLAEILLYCGLPCLLDSVFSRIWRALHLSWISSRYVRHACVLLHVARPVLVKMNTIYKMLDFQCSKCGLPKFLSLLSVHSSRRRHYAEKQADIRSLQTCSFTLTPSCVGF